MKIKDVIEKLKEQDQDEYIEYSSDDKNYILRVKDLIEALELANVGKFQDMDGMSLSENESNNISLN